MSFKFYFFQITVVGSCRPELQPIVHKNKLVCRNAVTGLVLELDVPNDSLQD